MYGAKKGFTLRECLIGDRTFYRHVAVVVLPIIVQNTLSNVVSLLDNVMVGQVGTLPMSAVAIINQLLFVFNLCIWGALAGAGIFGAQYYGQGNMEGVRQTLRMKLLIAAGLLVIAFGVLLGAGRPLIELYISADTTAADAAATMEYALGYLRVMLAGLISFALTQAYASTLRESGQTTLPMRASMIAMGINFVFNGLLIFGLFGFPALGVVGAGIATSLSRFVEFVIVVSGAHRSAERYPFMEGVFRNFHIDGNLARQVAIKGFPLLLNECLWSMSQAMLLQCYSVRGIQAIAAMNITNTITQIFNEVFLSLGNGHGHSGWAGAWCQPHDRCTPHRMADDHPECFQLRGDGHAAGPVQPADPPHLQHRTRHPGACFQRDPHGGAVHAAVRLCQRCLLYAAFRRQNADHLLF